MKKLLFAALLLISISSYSQTSIKVKVPKVNTTVTVTVPKGQVFNLDKEKDEGELTTNTAFYNKKTYPVYATKKGKLFIKLYSEAKQKEYRKYIKLP
jgi:argininosuccinate synthase